MFKVGFIGLGVISHENVLGYLDSADAQIVAVSCLDEVEAKHWLNRYNLGNARYYPDYERMLEKEQLDIVEILTPNYLHHSQVLCCAEANVSAISVQKPMALSLCQCDEMVYRCRSRGVVLRVYENFLFYPVYLKARELIEAGLIGELISIRVHTMTGLREGADWPWCWKPGRWEFDAAKAGFGPLTGDDGHHKVALVRWFMEREFGVVSAWIDPDTPLDAPALIRVRFRDLPGDHPKYGSIDYSFSPRMAIPFSFWFDEFVELVGSRGVMWINQCSAAGDRKMFEGNRMSSSPVFPPIAVFVNGEVETYLKDMLPEERNWSSSFRLSTKHLIDVLKGGGTPRMTGEEGKEMIRYLIATAVSAQQRREVHLDEITPEAEREGRIRIETNFCNLEAIRQST